MNLMLMSAMRVLEMIMTIKKEMNQQSAASSLGWNDVRAM